MSVTLFVLVLTAGWMAAHYLARLPYAPECPRCKAVTGQPERLGVVDRVISVLAATPVRHCGRCGWAGRMRWKLAAERARRPH